MVGGGSGWPEAAARAPSAVAARAVALTFTPALLRPMGRSMHIFSAHVTRRGSRARDAFAVHACSARGRWVGVRVLAKGAREGGAARSPPRVVGESLETPFASRAISIRPQTLSEGGHGGKGDRRRSCAHRRVARVHARASS